MLTKEQIQFLNEVCSDTWAECNGVISVEGSVDMENMNLTKIPVQFGQVAGYFNCYGNKLTTLEGTPFSVVNYFTCQRNHITSLEGGPKEVGGLYSCSDNKLTSLIGAPEICNDNFWCHENQLTSLEGCPSVIKGKLHCSSNPDLKYLYGIGIIGNVWYDNRNEINEWIIKLAREDIIFPYGTLEENINWIKNTRQYSSLSGAPNEIRQLIYNFIFS